MAYKNIRIRMKGGKTRLQRVRVLKSGKYRFVKNIGSRSRKLTGKVKKTTRKVGRKMARRYRRKRRRGARKFTLPIAPLVGLGVGIAPAIKDVMDGNIDMAVNKLKYSYLGLTPDNKFKVEGLMSGLVPLALGCAVHKFIGGPPINANRMLAAANVPIIRI